MPYWRMHGMHNFLCRKKSDNSDTICLQIMHRMQARIIYCSLKIGLHKLSFFFLCLEKLNDNCLNYFTLLTEWNNLVLYFLSEQMFHK